MVPSSSAHRLLAGAVLAGLVLMATAVLVAVGGSRQHDADASQMPTADPTPGLSPTSEATWVPLGSSTSDLGPDDAVQPTDDEMAMLERLVLFAGSPEPRTLDGVPLAADGVWLGLADELVLRRSPEELAKPSAWWIDLEAFRGYVGPFSALDKLGEWSRIADAPEVHEIAVSVGAHPHCASPPVPPPPQVAGLRRLSVQPAGVDTCLRWWTVDLFIAPEGTIAAITLDLWEP